MPKTRGTRRRAAGGAANRSSSSSRGRRATARSNDARSQEERPDPATSRPPSANLGDSQEMTIASMSLEQLMDAVKARVRQEMQAQSAVNAQLAHVTGPAQLVSPLIYSNPGRVVPWARILPSFE